MRKFLLNWLYHLQPLVPFYQDCYLELNYHFVCNTSNIQNSVVKCLLAASLPSLCPKFVKRHLGTTAKCRKKNQKIYDTNLYRTNKRPLHTAKIDRVNVIQECLPSHYF